ncbi:hypothetical protein LPJ61_005332, partial [Coemansia biformis]
MAANKTLRILHFNDVYNVSADANEPVGGAARFGGLLRSLQDNTAAGPTLTLFSGDAFFPSLESTISMGDHMRAVLNEMAIDVSLFGNHEFDKGVDLLEGLVERCNFPWIVTNLIDTATGTSAVRGSLPHLVKEVDGIRVGVIGIIEKDWLGTLRDLPATFQYQDYVESANRATEMLKDPAGAACDLVICLTHMRLNHNLKLANECPGVDLILAGHDHFYYVGTGVDELDDPDMALLPSEYMGHLDDRDMLDAWQAGRASLAPGARGSRVIISGTDFRDMSEITLHLEKPAQAVMEIDRVLVRRHRVMSKAPESLAVKRIVDDIESQLSQALDKVVGHSTAILDARSSVCRMQESSLGNLTSDLMRYYHAEGTGAQIALCCGGTFRSDKVFPAGAVRLREIAELFPFQDPTVVIKLTGEQIRLALENGVSKWPEHDGRFPQVSGIRYTFDPTRTPGDRIVSIVVTAEAKATARCTRTRATNTPAMSSRGSMIRLGATGDTPMSPPPLRHSDSATMIDGELDSDSVSDSDEDEPLDMDATYIVATREYMYSGLDGYTSLMGSEMVVDKESGIALGELFQIYFRGLATCNSLLGELRGAPKKQP